ncbi:MAG TPA: glycerate kinase, partial [Thermoleophilaceae bacterium]|nr:glycerate kinase [Thermoleophilaceae bacterium]
MTSSTPALVAPDDFKATLAATTVAAALGRGLRGAGLEAEEMPVADGGGGTLDVLLAAFGGKRRSARVSDPLDRPVDAEFGLLEDGRRAVVEMSQASGLWRVAEAERDAWAASTRGTG